MTVFEYLKKYKHCINFNLPLNLLDIIDNREVYCPTYNDAMVELSLHGLEQVANARFVTKIENEKYNIIYYLKDSKYYSDFDLRQFAKKITGEDI